MAGPALTKERFAANWVLVEKRLDSILWSVYASTICAMVLALACGLLILCLSPFISELKHLEREVRSLRLQAGGGILACAAVLAGIFFAEKRLWRGWLRSMDMECPACAHFLNRHTGEMLKPHEPGL